MPDVKKTDVDLYIMNAVRKKRQEVGMSQAVLAIKLNLSDAFIAQIENPNHRAKYHVNHLNALGKIFDCSPREFLPEKSL